MRYPYFIILLVAALIVLNPGCQTRAKKEMPGEEASLAPQAKVELPPAVAEVVNKYFSGAEIGLVETEKIDSTTLYDIEFKENKGEIEIAEDGTVIDISSIITWEELPVAVAESIKKVTEETGSTVVRLEKAEVQAEIKEQAGKKVIIKLASPIFLYEAELARTDQKGEVQVDAEGKIVEGPKWELKEKQ